MELIRNRIEKRSKPVKERETRKSLMQHLVQHLVGMQMERWTQMKS